MNKSIRSVAIFCLLLITVMLANLTWVQVFSEDRYAKHPLDRRPYYALASTERGQITAGGQILAHSVKGADGFYHREYVTDPAAFGPVEGYLSQRYGAAGVERSYNSVLNGTDDSLFTHQLWDRLTGQQSAGANVELTIRPKLQQLAYQQLQSRGYEGAVVAIKPSTGEILAMASSPSYNPANIVGVDSDTAESNWNALINNPQSPLLNHATQDPLPPGSTFKVITTAAAIEKNKVNANTTVTAAPQITLPGTTATMENYAGTRCAGGDTTTLGHAFAKSCNTAFAELGMAVGIEQFEKTARAFGIGDPTDNLGVPVDTSTIGQIADKPALAQSSIGQRDVALTPLQNAVIAATVANGGERMRPYLVKQVTGPDLEPIDTTVPHREGRAIEKPTADLLTQLMIGSEQFTTGASGLDIASKTGTAEHGVDSRGSKPHAWYIAFGPTKKADVAVAVVVENGGDLGQAATGGSVAAPIGRAVIAEALKEGES